MQNVPISSLITGNVNRKIYEWNKRYCPVKDCSRCRLLTNTKWRICHEQYMWGIDKDEGHGY